jgi:hypothetical protein
MISKLLSIIAKPMALKIAWLGGSLAVITAILSASGFLVIRAHQHLLGIAGVVPGYPESWTGEGAQFVYNSLLSLFLGLSSSSWVILLILLSVLLPVIMRSARLMTTIQAKTQSSGVKMLILLLSLMGVLVVMIVFFQYGGVSNLLVVHQTFDNELVIRGDKQGINDLQIQYAILVSLLLFVFVWLRLLPRILTLRFEKNGSDSTAKETSASSQPSRWHLMLLLLWFFFLISLVYLPTNYGKMVRPNKYFRVRLIMKQDTSSSSYEGWLLHKDSEEIVMYTGTPAVDPLHVFQRKDFDRIEIVGFGNIFSER